MYLPAIFICLSLILFNSYVNSHYTGVPCTVIKTSDITLNLNIDKWVIDVTVDIHGTRFVVHDYLSPLQNNSSYSDISISPGTTLTCLTEFTGVVQPDKVWIIDPDLDIPPYHYYLGITSRTVLLLVLVIMFISVFMNV
jgi:hypothetical protein